MKILRLGTTSQDALALYFSGLCYFFLNDRINCQINIFRFLSSKKGKDSHRSTSYTVLYKLYAAYGCFAKLDYNLIGTQIQSIFESPTIYNECGNYLIKLRKFSEAIPWLLKSLLLKVKRGQIQYLSQFVGLAVSHKKKKNYPKALKFYKYYLKFGGNFSQKNLINLIIFYLKGSFFRVFHKQIFSLIKDKAIIDHLCSRMMKFLKRTIHYVVLGKTFKNQEQNSNQKKTNKQSLSVSKLIISERLKQMMTLKKMKLNCLRLAKLNLNRQFLEKVNTCLKDIKPNEQLS